MDPHPRPLSWKGEGELLLFAYPGRCPGLVYPALSVRNRGFAVVAARREPRPPDVARIEVRGSLPPVACAPGSDGNRPAPAAAGPRLALGDRMEWPPSV